MNGDQNLTGASSSGASVNNTKSFVSLSSNRASPFPTTTAATSSAMAAPAFLPSAQAFRPSATPQSAYPLSINSISPFDRTDAAVHKPVGTPYSTTPAALTSAKIRKLPLDTTEESLRILLTFATDLAEFELLPVDQSEDKGFLSAVLRFRSPAGAQQVKDFLDGKKQMIVEILGSSPTSRRYPIDTPVSSAATNGLSAASSAASSRQASRFNGAFQPLDTPPLNGVSSTGSLTSPESSAHYQNLFSPNSPIGNHLTDRTRITGKSLINNDTTDDDETGELLKDPVGFAENGLQRRQTAPVIPISQLSNLSLNTAVQRPSQLSHYGHTSMGGGISSLSGTMSPTVMGAPGASTGFGQQPPYRAQHHLPPANPADQNPPCNTLYVGNLPVDTSEEELKAMFSKQRGYKRLCFRTKQNGPMCFVEFEDISFATKALHELYGYPLHNSVKGGIRLSFSKNPLGVRSGQTPGQAPSGSMAGVNGIHPGSTNGFTTANGPPPGLTAPPGLGINRAVYSGSPNLATGGANQYSAPGYPSTSTSGWNGTYGGHPSMMASSSAFPPNMMGR